MFYKYACSGCSKVFWKERAKDNHNRVIKVGYCSDCECRIALAKCVTLCFFAAASVFDSNDFKEFEEIWEK